MIRTSGRSALAATAMPGDQPAAADPDDDRADVGHCSRISSADRALAGDHVGVVERVDQDGARPLGELPAATSASSTVAPASSTVAP